MDSGEIGVDFAGWKAGLAPAGLAVRIIKEGNGWGMSHVKDR